MMIHSVVVSEGAQADTLNAYLYYEEKQTGLGVRFINELNERYKQLAQNPQHYSYISADKEKTLRRVKLKNFPYVVIYDFTDTRVVVYTIHNCYKRRSEHYE